ncbi:MAG: lipid kinase [Prevotella sp.]|nr:lipid kinase [Prevotella sp.]
MAVESTRWGIVYCPKSKSSKRWERIRQLLDARQVSYDFVQSESRDSVYRIVTMFVQNGYKTIVIVGGDSALNDAVNSLMHEEKRVRDEIVLGLIPNGLMDDFARFWGFTDMDDEQIIGHLLKRRVRRIDLGCIRYVNKKQESCHRYFLNCVNIGLTADIMNLRRQTRHIFGLRTLSYLTSLLLLLFHRQSYRMLLRINTDVVDRQVMTVCIGNARGYGQTPSAVPYNGLLDVSVVCNPKVLKLFTGMWLLITGRFLNHHDVHPYRTREIVVEKSSRAFVGIDGRLISTPVGEYRVQVEQEVINFLIPS